MNADLFTALDRGHAGASAASSHGSPKPMYERGALA